MQFHVGVMECWSVGVLNQVYRVYGGSQDLFLIG